jgi:DNA-directed RNA polymerase specialized sigma24 family protein
LKPVPAHTDPELVALLKQKDPGACIFLYEKYAGPLYGLISQVLSDTTSINETFVEAFTRIIHSIDQHDPAKTRLFTWMMQLARQTAIEKLKSTTSRIYSGSAVTEHGGKVVGGMTADLHYDEQQVLNLAYLKGYTVEEMAGQLGMSAASVKETMNKALLAINSKTKM